MTDRIAWMDALLATPNDDEHGGIDAYARAVAFVLYRHMNASGHAKPGTRTIAREAGVSHSVAEARIRVLEEAGWLMVTRRPGAGNRYSTTAPTAPRDSAVSDEPTAPTAPFCSAVMDEADADRATTAPCEFVKPQGTAPPGGHEPEPVTTTSIARSPHEGASFEYVGDGIGTGASVVVHQRPQRPVAASVVVTPKRIFTEMARRKLALAREVQAEWAPPAGCDKRREDAWLRTEFDALRSTHGFALDHLLATRSGRDPDYYVWKLDPALAKRNWAIPSLEETRARVETERAEREARRAARTPEQYAAEVRILHDLKAQIAARASA